MFSKDNPVSKSTFNWNLVPVPHIISQSKGRNILTCYDQENASNSENALMLK